jgi:nucleoside-diphosphate-sugar epimerase
VFQEKRDWDKSTRRRASIDKAGKLLNFRPSADMERGVGLTVKWIKENWDRIKDDAQF